MDPSIAAATVATPLDVVAAATGARTTGHTAPGATVPNTNAVAAAVTSARAAGLLPSILYGDLDLPGYPASMGDLSAPAALSPTGFSRQPPSGFTAPRLPVADTEREIGSNLFPI
jgi:hypothetical protein